MSYVLCLMKGQYDNADWFNDNPNRTGGTAVARTDATVAQYCSYIKGILTKDWAVSNRPAVKVSALGYPSRLGKNTDNKDTTWIRLTCVWFYNCQAGRIVMSSSKLMPVVTRPRTIKEVPSQPSESFLKHVSDSHLDKLYDLPEDIQDVMGLHVLRPSAAVCKVMTIPNNKCVRIVTPDEHVSTGFHEILVNDMGQEEWPQVPLSDIGCLRLDWPKDLFTFVGRYQLELEQMRKVCRDRFGPAASGTCPTCEKYIQVNLGKHVALCHLDLAQLWRCPVAWCLVWKGTSQDCVDHMRRAHNTPVTVKAGNLARWFPPWTVTREQWHSMSRPSVSGIAIDTFLFSRIGMPLFHRYRVFVRLGGHPAFRGPYMSRLFAFLKEADAESIRRSHRRRAKEIVASMSKGTSPSKEVPAASPQDFKVTLLYDSEDSCTPVGSIVFSSNEDLPLSPGQEDRRKVRKRDTRAVSQLGLTDGPASEPTQMERPVETETDSVIDKPPEAELPAWSDTEIMPLIIIENS